VQASIRALEGLLGTVTITLNVASAHGVIDGREIATAPGDVRVPGGPHTIELRAQGYAPTARDITIAAHGHVELRIELAEVSSFEGMDRSCSRSRRRRRAWCCSRARRRASWRFLMHGHETSQPDPMLRPETGPAHDRRYRARTDRQVR